MYMSCEKSIYVNILFAVYLFNENGFLIVFWLTITKNEDTKTPAHPSLVDAFRIAYVNSTTQS